MFELAIAAFLILLNGVFSLSELAVVSSRKARLKLMADQHRRGAAAALALAQEPGRFLSTVQIGITLIGVLAGAFSGAALGDRLSDALEANGLSRALANPLGYGTVIAIITYLSVVIGELVPKTLALRNPERVACLVAPLMRVVSIVGAPLVILLDVSTRMILRLFGFDSEGGSAVTEEEVRAIMAEAETSGAIESYEHRMISGVLRLDDRSVRALMTPRIDVDRVSLDDSEEAQRTLLLSTPHARLPVSEGGEDHIVGVIQVRDLLPGALRGDALDIRGHVRPAPVVPDRITALETLGRLREADVPIALVHDEYGHFEGLVTPADLLDAIAGAFRADADLEETEASRREDGSWLLAGSLPADAMAETLRIALPEKRDYHTVAGLVIEASQSLPRTGETVEALGWRFEVVDMDGRRIDKVLASKLS